MRERSELWKSIAASGDYRVDTVAVIGGVTYAAISAPVINRAMIADGFSVGNCVAASMQVSVMTEDTIPDSAEVVIRSRLTKDMVTYTEWKDMGTFYIDKRKKDQGLVSLQCYDAMLKANQIYTDDTADDDRIGWPKSMKACVEEIAYRLGIQIDSRTVIKTTDPYQVDYPAKKTMMDVLGWIGAVHGGNWIITPENKLRLVPLVAPPAETWDIIDEYYNRIYTDDGHKLVWQHSETGQTISNRAGGDFCYVPVVVGKITTGKTLTVSRVTVARDENLGYTGGDDSGFELSIEDNPCASQAVCDDLLEELSGMIYAPYTVEQACYDPAAELGDWLIVGDQVRSVLYAETVRLDVVMRSNLEAPGKDELDSEYPYLSSIEKLNKNAERLEKYMEDTKYYLDSKIEQTYEEITLEVSLLKETDEITTEAVNQLRLDIDGIELSAVSKNGGAYLQLTNGVNSTEVALSLSVSNAVTESTIQLTAGGITVASEKISFSGLVTYEGLAGGTTTIDGACIKTGTIDAARINLSFDTDGLATKDDVTAAIEAFEDGMVLSTSNGSSSSTISLKSGGTTISSASITLTGMVTFSDLSTAGWTTINGSNITTGTIDADLITTGTLNASYIELANSFGGFTCAYGYDGESYTYGAMVYGSGNNCYFIATNSGVRMQAYSTSFYCSTNVIGASRSISVASDRRMKNSIDYDLDRYDAFFLSLQPCVYHYNDRPEDPLCTGFIAQDVEQALTENGLGRGDFAGLNVLERTGEDGEVQTEYMLAYEQFISINTHMIQKLYHRINTLEQRLRAIGG